MTDANNSPQIPWWVGWWTDPTTTRSSLRQQAWLFFLLAAAFVGINVVSGPWRPTRWMREIYQAAAAGLLPVGFTGAGIWILAAVRWIDRHQAWDRLATKQEREAHQERHALWLRSFPLGFVLMAIGAAVGALVGWVWANENGILGGLVLGVASGFVLGVTLAGFKEGVRSSARKSADVESQGAEPHAPGDSGRDAGGTPH